MKDLICRGLFVRNDVNNNPCYVGDFVKITRPSMEWEKETEEGNYVYTYVDAKTWNGQIRMLLSKGIVINTHEGYIKAPLTNNSRNIWKWKKINKN